MAGSSWGGAEIRTGCWVAPTREKYNVHAMRALARSAATCVVCATLLWSGPALAQEPAGAALDSIRESILYARYEEAVTAATTLLERDDLSARERNEALELVATAQLANQETEAATETLERLYARDPQHRLSDADASPTVQAAFARVRESSPNTVPVVIEHQPPGALARRSSPLIEASLSAGGSAVDEMRVLWRRSGETRFSTTVMTPENGVGAARIPLLDESDDAYVVEYFIEALAPSRTVLARAGSRSDPLRLTVPEASAGPAPLLATGGTEEPPAEESGGVLSQWWFWGIVALAVGGGVAATLLLTADDPPEGSLGNITVGLW